ncbi:MULTISPECIES: HAD-IA family hydrolase [Thiorhodovibrio]|uniref:HAD-IA family hydrolase n=1 Tax=Thiorhodovibrio TaxID=61593 RepID=UPI001914D96E|nr:HAD-IA family hydrolase [Thiorhodovibrio litoralis]MBK5969797.1 phosphatase [Thiorhodovibrio winogradskyi]WPL12159.1 Phosphorylated carbohydrates phosphatase [Thiorhodovibrio litoralis]
MKQPRALIFDVDGTLADTERDGHRVAFNAAFAEVGLDWQWSESLYGELLQVAGGKERIARYIDLHCPGFSPPEGQVLGDFIAGLHQAKTRHYVALLAQGGVPLRSGVLRLLREARAAGVRLAIATTTTPENVTALLDNAGEPCLRDWFEVIAAGDVVPRKKPAPDIFTLALEQLGLKPEDCAVIEDSDNGAASALAAGLKSLVVTLSHYTREQDFGAAALVVDELGEPNALGRIAGGVAVDSLGVEELAGICVDLALIQRLHQAVWGGSSAREGN